jgi:hypothetical protein
LKKVLDYVLADTVLRAISVAIIGIVIAFGDHAHDINGLRINLIHCWILLMILYINGIDTCG